jgi:alkanesulfonate monooxygenase SsuD/methylene tetrahydromethanopterin reductase-like flavin-dependent oxidoreductase (luciferase family)
VSFELGVYSFGNTPRTTDSSRGSTAQAIRDVLEAVHVAEEVGLDFFGFGEHHTRSMPLSSPTALVNAAAASTHRIGLGTTVTVLSTDEPIRLFQQFATAAAIAPGRIEAVAGRGSSAITFPIFDLDVSDYDMLYRSKLDLLLKLNGPDRVTWSGPHRRRPLHDTLVVPRPEQPLRIWLGTGGSPQSMLRAVQLGLPMFLGILGGTPEHWAQYGHAYRNAWADAGHPADAAQIAVAVHGFVAQDDRQAKAIYLVHETRMFQEGMADIGRTGPPPSGRAANYEPRGMVFSSASVGPTRSPTASSTSTSYSATPASRSRATNHAPASLRATACLSSSASRAELAGPISLRQSPAGHERQERPTQPTTARAGQQRLRVTLTTSG